MAFSRNNYDSCAYDLKIKRSTDQGDYRLYGYFAENENQCYSYNGPIGSKSDVSLVKNTTETCFGTMAEVESDLTWRNNKLDRCNDKKFNKFPVIDKPICASNLTSQDTRFTNPIDNYRGMSLTSYMLNPYLSTNPQCYIQEVRNLVGSNTRLETKDCYDLTTNIKNNSTNINRNGNYADSCTLFPNDDICHN
jgi:hypothetical protein